MAQYVYRRPPYSYYDIEGIESWLEDLITDGLWLDKNGYVFGFMQFRPGTPRKLKYRLEPIPKRKGFGGTADDPDEKALTLYEEFGWEYLGTFIDFYIYRSMDEYPVELNTDPTLQAQTLAHLRRRSGWVLGFMALLIFTVSFLLLREGRILLEIIKQGWQHTALFALYLFIVPIYFLHHYLHLTRLQKKLGRGEPLERNKNWRKGSFLRRILISLPFLAFLLSQWSNVFWDSSIDRYALDPSEVSDPLPFVTMEQLDPERIFEEELDTRLSLWSTPFTPVNSYWFQYGSLSQPGENRWSGGLEIYRHEATHSWIADRLMTEYQMEQDKYMEIASAPGATYEQVPLDASDFGFDELIVYCSRYGAFILIREDNTVIKASVTIHVWNDQTQLYPLWLEKIAAQYT